MSLFKQKVIDVIRLVPFGTVVSYGQVAVMIGVPRAARQVGWILNSTEGKDDLPWWRVMNNVGYLSIRGTKLSDKELQAKLLRAEGIEVNDDFTLDMKKYRFRPDEKFLKRFQLTDECIQMVREKYLL
ncbi:MGMT family protein [soil metagenome]